MILRNQYFIKLVIALISIIPTMININNQDIPIFLLSLLLYSLNVRLRKVLTNKAFSITSIFLDLIIIHFIFNRFSGMTYLLILITLIDGVLYVENYSHSIIIISSIFIMYLINDKELEIILLVLFILCSLVLFTTKNKLKTKKISELEYLYDDVRRYSYELEQAKKQVELYSCKVEELTQIQERERISREIHDTIGHKLTALLFQLEAGVRLLESDKEKSKELLLASRENLRESIDVLRETVRSMKPKGHKNFTFSMNEMIKKFKADTGINISFSVKGNPVELYPGAELVLYKNTQEALTNAVRHSNTKNIIVNLIYKGEEVSISITNDGCITKDIKKGLGITGMEERLSFIGGRLNIFIDSEFIVENVVPIKGA